MIIAVDIDNVLCNLQEVVVRLFNERYGTNYTLNDFTEYDVMNVLPTADAVKMRDIYGESGLYNLVKPLPGAQDTLQKLVNMGHHVYLVTDAIPSTYGEKVEFIQRYFPCISVEHIVSMKHKHLFKCDILVEDNLANLLAGQHYFRVLMNWPWNESKKDYIYSIERCYGWSDILAAINKISDLE